MMVDKIKVNHLSSRQDIEAFAITERHPLLYHCVKVGKNNGFSWEQTMQFAAINLSEALKELSDLKVKQLEASNCPAPFLIKKLAQARQRG